MMVIDKIYIINVEKKDGDALSFDKIVKVIVSIRASELKAADFAVNASVPGMWRVFEPVECFGKFAH